ncbi:uncharacterized protein BT62DRAFT_1009263 [Guyanagaster necrorhizus]|uniref:Uncharacterized protein n=1 Tax=Guyanagaster necrorhizus TaxID=856835 RepID=A0A9P7VMP9_9AGAR|nr:uncharacterized protein BT62DRAFT_1009263 [Guyanagaster necrorhizus MCA 3950]KAG7443447.1 hypothetical protein BT62DRAFT_1009263 [Guyanagaster necrorhizus MCA 3950]
MYNSSRVWSPPPPSYRTVPNEEAGLSDEHTPLKPRAVCGKRLATLKVLAFIVVVALAFHLVSDYTDTERRRRREDAVARREDAVRAKEDAILADEERRERAELAWWDLTMEKRCLGYEKRIYHAELLNVPASEDAHGWCMKTSIDIHGITYDHPELCTSELIDGAIKTIGHWTVRSNEPTCKTWWGGHQKKDCFGAHKRRVEAKLFNHQEPWDNWAEMCFSTPSEFAWQKFDHPDTCENKGRDGIVGSWFIEVDESECP